MQLGFPLFGDQCINSADITDSVKAIIQDMGGRIDIHSESGSGTDVIVRIPLTSATPLRMEGLNTVNEVREKVNGLHFRLDGFERYPDISEAPTGILSADAEAAMLLKFAVQKSLAEWFGMENIVSSADGNAADVVVIMEAGLGDKSLENVLQSYPAGKEKAVAIVLTSRYHSGPKVDAHDNFRIFYLQQPWVFIFTRFHEANNCQIWTSQGGKNPASSLLSEFGSTSQQSRP